jgi:hypothetical protein
MCGVPSGYRTPVDVRDSPVSATGGVSWIAQSKMALGPAAPKMMPKMTARVIFGKMIDRFGVIDRSVPKMTTVPVSVAFDRFSEMS